MAIDVETKRIMENWARWKKDGSSIGFAMSAAYDLAARGTREGTSIPLINGEAIDVERAVKQLPEELKKVVEEFWLTWAATRKKASRCRCSEATFYRRLHQAHHCILEHLKSLRRRAQRQRDAPGQR